MGENGDAGRLEPPIDWLTQIGHDPNRKKYSASELALLPARLRGRYDRVGWTANGVKPWGLQHDPIAADGFLFFRGWFNLVLSIYKYISGDDKWERPFKVTGYRDRQFTWDHEHNEMFGWFFRLNESFPRGQASAMMMVSEVGSRGVWTRAFAAPHLGKFEAPTVEGIDYPSLGVSQAWNDPASGTLHVVTYAAAPDRRGAATSWMVTKLRNPSGATVSCDGEPFNRIDVTGNDRIRLNTTIDSRYYQIRTNTRTAGGHTGDDLNPRLRARGEVAVEKTAISDQLDDVRSAGLELLAGGGPTCPCCTGV